MTELRPDQRCHHRDCPRKRDKGWTTCARHHTAGISIRQWNKRTKGKR
jgi:hypothetical protein